MLYPMLGGLPGVVLTPMLMPGLKRGLLRPGSSVVNEEHGVRASLGLMFLLKPSSLGFTALRIPLHWDPYHWAPPALGDPYPQLHPH